MKDILKPVVVFALGFVIGAGGIWLLAKPDISGFSRGVPDVKGISGVTFASLDNQTVAGVQVNTALDGYINAITGSVVVLISGRGDPREIGVVVNDQTTIFGIPAGSGNETPALKLSDLRVGDRVSVFATVEGTALVAQTISKVE